MSFILFNFALVKVSKVMIFLNKKRYYIGNLGNLESFISTTVFNLRLTKKINRLSSLVDSPIFSWPHAINLILKVTAILNHVILK